MATTIDQVQLLQQNLQAVSVQKQQYETQLIEIESALAELSAAEKAYKIVGKLMIASSREKLAGELQEKKNVAELRLRNFRRQEEMLQKNLERAQQQLLEEMKKKK